LVKAFLFIFLSICITATGYGQYPFEKYPAVKYKRMKFRISYSKDSLKVYYTLNIPRLKHDRSKYSIMMTAKNQYFRETSTLYIKKNDKIFQKLSFNGDSLPMSGLNYLYIADINGDSLPDIKFSFNMYGNGISGLVRTRIYLFKKSNGSFNKISYKDMSFNTEDEGLINYFPERNFDLDGHFKIMTCYLNTYKAHNYWIFDVYEYKDGNLVCVDDKYNYPIMIQYLYRPNYKITKRISTAKMKTFKKLKPNGYSKS
jgi:hypothetical protein